MIDDERTELRRDRVPVEEATRAVDRSLDLRGPAAHSPAPGPTGRIAQVPGATADAAAYGIRRSASTLPVTRAAASDTPVRRRVATPRPARSGLAVVLAVAAFALVLAGAAVVLVLLVAS